MSITIAGTMIDLYDMRFVRMQVRSQPSSEGSSLRLDGDGGRRLAKSGHAN